MSKMLRKRELMIACTLCAASYMGAVQAISQAEPGEALLIPYVLYDSSKNINTLTGITIPSTLGNDPTQIEIGGNANSGNHAHPRGYDDRHDAKRSAGRGNYCHDDGQPARRPRHPA